MLPAARLICSATYVFVLSSDILSWPEAHEQLPIHQAEVAFTTVLFVLETALLVIALTNAPERTYKGPTTVF